MTKGKTKACAKPPEAQAESVARGPVTTWRPYPFVDQPQLPPDVSRKEKIRVFLKRVGNASRSEIIKAVGGPDDSSLTKDIKASGAIPIGRAHGRNRVPCSLFALKEGLIDASTIS